MRTRFPASLTMILVSEVLVFSVLLVELYTHGKSVWMAVGLLASCFGVTIGLWNQFAKARQSTYAAGSFPANLKVIRKNIERTKGDVFIKADCIDYGSFWAPEEFERVKSGIVRAVRRGRNVTMLIAGGPATITRGSGFFDFVTRFSELRESKQFKIFFGKHWPGLTFPSSAEGLKELLDEYQSRVFAELKAVGVKIVLTPEARADQSVEFVWITKEAVVFSTPMPGATKPARSFVTENPNLIKEHKVRFLHDLRLAERNL